MWSNLNDHRDIRKNNFQQKFEPFDKIFSTRILDELDFINLKYLRIKKKSKKSKSVVKKI